MRSILPYPPVPSSVPQGDQSKMAQHKEPRSKACTACRRSKVRCVKDANDQVCKRCKAQGIPCVYEYKVASYKVVGNNNKLSPQVDTYSVTNHQASNKEEMAPGAISNLLNPNQNHNKVPETTVEGESGPWQSSVEGRLQDFDSKLGKILHLLQNSGPAALPSVPSEAQRVPRTALDGSLGKQRPSPPLLSASSSYLPPLVPAAGATRKRSAESESADEIPPKKQRQDEALARIITKSEAQRLFDFFDENISIQLFGFEIKDYEIEEIWDSCPLLVATVCCISAMHNSQYSDRSGPLAKLIKNWTQELLFDVPRTETQAFNTVMALCFCGFWFQKDQLFTGIALQLAKTMQLISPLNKKSKIPKKDRIKLWYLLYILDGQQALVFNRQTLTDSRESTLTNARKLLLAEDQSDAKSTALSTGISANYSNLRLVSQVEYHQALDHVFTEDAWDLLTPASFGLPFKSNLELDKWMVQWTVLLSPFKMNPTWSSKSTLIYYNFAKMHINSAAVRKLQITGDDLPEIDQNDIDEQFGKRVEELDDDKFGDSDDDSDDEDDVKINEAADLFKDMSPMESRRVSSRIALSAAETVLNIVLADSDILSALQYVPIHIHIMLYYAALLVLRPPSYLVSGSPKSLEDSINSIHLGKKLAWAIRSYPPTDKQFAGKLVAALDRILEEKEADLTREIGHVQDSNDRLQLQQSLDAEYKPKNTRKHKIMAWPGVDSGHPE